MQFCDIPFEMERPFTLPTFTYFDTVGLGMLTPVHTPNLKTLVVRTNYIGGLGDIVHPPPSWPSHATLCLILKDAHDDEITITRLLVSNPSIKRLVFLGCNRIHDMIRLLGEDDTGNLWIFSLTLTRPRSQRHLLNSCSFIVRS